MIVLTQNVCDSEWPVMAVKKLLTHSLSICLSVCVYVCLTVCMSVCVCVCRMDKLHMALTELCFAINYCSVITVWEHGFVPRDFFTQHLELRFNKYSQAHTDIQ